MDNNTSVLVQRSRRAPKLTSDSEKLLLRRWQRDGDQQAANELAESALRYVVSCAFRYQRYGTPLDALIAEGNMGLLRAMEKFDTEREIRFSTYAAYWIRSFIIDHILRSWSMVGGGSGALKTRIFFRLRRESSRAMSLCGDGEQADDMVAQRMSMTVAKVGQLRRQIESRDVSLQAPAHEDGGETMVDLLPSENSEVETLERVQLLERMTPIMREALSSLNSRERFIVEKRLMADAAEEMSLSAIGQVFGVSRERVRQLEQRIKEKLKGALAVHRFSEELMAA